MVCVDKEVKQMKSIFYDTSDYFGIAPDELMKTDPSTGLTMEEILCENATNPNLLAYLGNYTIEDAMNSVKECVKRGYYRFVILHSVFDHDDPNTRFYVIAK